VGRVDVVLPYERNHGRRRLAGQGDGDWCQLI
jgi:hypothetical protein